MSIFTRVQKWFGGNDTAQRRGDQRIEPSVAAHEDAPFIGIDKAMQVSTVWACVMMLAENIASLPLNVLEPAKAGGMTKLPRSTRVQMILHSRPNSRQNVQEFWEQMLLSFYLRGNAYALIKRDAKGEIIALWPLATDQVNAVLLRTGDVVYEYYFDNARLLYLERDVLHIRGPGNGIVGMSPLDHMRSSVGLAIDTQNHTTKVYRKNARRPGVLMSDVVLKEGQRAAIKEEFGNIVTGKAGELYVLEAQFKFEPLGMTPADLELLNSRKFAVQDLARWFGVPSVLINDTGESTALGSSTAQIIEAFFKLKLRPSLNRMELAMVHQILSPSQRAKGYTIKFTFDAILRATLKDRMDIYAKAAQNAIKTRNEIRALEDDPPIAGGDILTVQSNLVPLEKLEEIAMSRGTQQAAPVPEEPIQQ